MTWENLLEGNCPNCACELVQTSYTRGELCEACDFSMLEWERQAMLTGIRAGYTKPDYKPKFGDDPLTLEWIRDPAAARMRFLPK